MLPPLRKVRGIIGIIGCVIRLGVPIVGERQNEENAMLLGEPNNRVELLKAVRTIVDGKGTIAVDELEPSADFRNGSNIWNQIRQNSGDKNQGGKPLKAQVRTALKPALEMFPRTLSMSSSEFRVGNQ